MADREPRRRKRRKDIPKRDDVHSDELFFSSSSKTEIRDSDLEVEEEPAPHAHSGPNMFSQIVFVILFSGLVFSMGFIFLSLQGADRVDDSLVVSQRHSPEAELKDEHSSEIMFDDLSSEILYNDRDDHSDQVEELAGDDDHGNAENEISLENLFESSMNTLSSFFSTKDSNVEKNDADETEGTESSFEESQPDSDVTTGQSIMEEFVENYMEPTSYEAEVHERTTEAYEDTTPMSSFEDEYPIPEPKETKTTPPQPDPAEVPVPAARPDEQQEAQDTNDFESEDLSFYDLADITNENDFEIRDELDDIDRRLEKSPEKALAKSEELLLKKPRSPRALYAKAQALDKLAEKHLSNKQLEEAIATYQRVMSLEDSPQKLYLLAGRKAADRLRFRGFTGKSVKLLTEMAKKFPLDVNLKNEVAVGYLLIGQNVMAKNVLLDALKTAPDSGFAKVHLGFILKTEDSNYGDAIKYLREGIESREPGVIDGRFYFHLGDALHRVGKKEEAQKVYEEAVEEGLFMSVYQRSLYNVDGLTGKPWWDPMSTLYAPYFKILEKNWEAIRDEALSLMDEKYAGFLPEAEGLQERGEWKQLELFSRGRKMEKNCQKAPRTCAVVSQLPDAVSCKRGQVKFSIMHPQTHVWAHTGPTNCRLRSHLGLVVPDGASIRVADEIRKWEDGKVILFDDSFEHEVWHNGSSYRLVLIVDFWHPELTAYHKRSLTPI